MKKVSSSMLLLIAAMVMNSCGDRSSSTTSETSVNSDTSSMTSANTMSDTGMNNMDHSNNTSTTTTVDLSGTAGPTNFATTAASGGLMEVEAAKVAIQNATSADVKELARMIQKDHTAANSELKKIAGAKSITLPTEMMGEHRSHVDMLKAKTGADFDRAYLDMMDQDHTKDIDMFTQASNNLSDAELKAFAAKTLPVLQKHKDKVKSVQAKM